MFEEQYRADNDAIQPPDESLKKAAASMRREMERRPAGPPRPAPAPKRRKKRMGLRVVLAAAACVALVLAAFPAAKFFGSLALPRETVPAAKSYRQVFGVVREVQRLNAGVYDFTSDFLSGLANFSFGAKNEMATSPGASDGSANSGASGYSGTNLQVDGVEEADVVKTDGRYLYIVSDSTVRIVSVDKGRMAEVSRIEASKTDDGEERRPFELYVTENRLIVLRRVLAEWPEDYGDTVSSYLRRYGSYGAEGIGSVEAAVYDIMDRRAPVLLHTQGQSGSYLSSRMVGDTLYVVTSHWVLGTVKRGDPASFVPALYTDGEKRAMPAQDITLCPRPSEPQYVVATGLDTRKPETHTASRAVMGGGKNLYADTDSLYVAVTDYATYDRGSLDVTTLLKFNLERGRVDYAGTATVPGTLLNQFSMDENGGYVRLVTTVQGGGSNLYVLDTDLKTCGKLENVAPGERLYAVRFVGDTGYFVTFRQTDPLFAVDLKDPRKPTLLSALKIPGFSQYLHPFADGRLLGLGKDADPVTGAAGGLKLSMFDVSDPRSVTEKHTELLGMAYSDSEALQNHKAVLISREKNLIAFSSSWEYLIYGYSEDAGFTRRAALSPPAARGDWMRGLYSGDVLYLCTESGVAAYSLTDFAVLDTLPFT